MLKQFFAAGQTVGVVAMLLVGIHSAARAHTSTAALTARSTADRPDDISGPQVHVVYAVPQDGADRQLDLNGALEQSVGVAQTWLRSQNANHGLRFDTSGGVLDVTFVRLPRTDADIKSTGAFVRDQIESAMKSAGLLAAGKIYLVYYDGGSTFACGGGAWPPDLPGQVAALYLNGTPPGAIPCGNNPLATAGGAPAYWEFSALHEVMHTLGFIPKCAPHHVLNGHVGDDPRDLMYAGPLPWQPSILDFNGDDYVKAPSAGCLSISDSPYFEGAPSSPTPPPNAAPFGSFDTPANGAAGLTGAIAVTGWALDDAGVAKVDILRDAHPGDPSGAVVNGRVFIGTATFVAGARPDIAAAFSTYPNAGRAGWGYMMLTRGLIWDGQGPFNLYAIATDTNGAISALGSKRITIDNGVARQPFGSIDTPGQGATVSGVLVNFGWVLPAARGATIPAANVKVAIDGAFLPLSSECLTSRPDITAGFPSFDTSQAIRCFVIDTTKYANGLHTIGWLVSDSAGHADGIGSRFFTIANPQLVTTTVTPGQPLVITGDGFNASEAFDVVLRPASGAEYRIPVTTITPSRIEVTAPPLLDPTTGLPSAGTVSVVLVRGGGSHLLGSLEIQPLPAAAGAAGQATLTTATGLIAQVDAAIQAWQRIELNSRGLVSTSARRARLLALRARLMALRDDVERVAAGRATVTLGTTPAGQPVTLNASSIALLDRLMTAFPLSHVPQASGAVAGVGIAAASTRPPGQAPPPPFAAARAENAAFASDTDLDAVREKVAWAAKLRAHALTAGATLGVAGVATGQLEASAAGATIAAGGYLAAYGSAAYDVYVEAGLESFFSSDTDDSQARQAIFDDFLRQDPILRGLNSLKDKVTSAFGSRTADGIDVTATVDDAADLADEVVLDANGVAPAGSELATAEANRAVIESNLAPPLPGTYTGSLTVSGTIYRDGCSWTETWTMSSATLTMSGVSGQLSMSGVVSITGERDGCGSGAPVNRSFTFPLTFTGPSFTSGPIDMTVGTLTVSGTAGTDGVIGMVQMVRNGQSTNGTGTIFGPLALRR